MSKTSKMQATKCAATLPQQEEFCPSSLAQLFGRYACQNAPSTLSPFGPESSWQKTLAQDIHCDGIGLHSGAQISLHIKPAPADTGIVFLRVDAPAGDDANAVVPALFGRVCQSTLCSTLGNSPGLQIGTVEHILAAFAGLGVDNAYVHVDGPEIPIMDGSALKFVELLDKAGLVILPVPRCFLRITKPVRVSNGHGSFCTLTPMNGCRFDVEIDFANKVIGHSKARLDLNQDHFRKYVAQARTFCAMKDVEAMQAAGLALGGSLDNAIVVDDDHILNADGLRIENEFAHHKLLDAIGDIYLLGLRMIGAYYGYKSGHALHNKLLHKLFHLGHFELVRLNPQQSAQPSSASASMAAQ